MDVSETLNAFLINQCSSDWPHRPKKVERDHSDLKSQQTTAFYQAVTLSNLTKTSLLSAPGVPQFPSYVVNEWNLWEMTQVGKIYD